jgi:hypothetical protein
MLGQSHRSAASKPGASGSILQARCHLQEGLHLLDVCDTSTESQAPRVGAAGGEAAIFAENNIPAGQSSLAVRRLRPAAAAAKPRADCPQASSPAAAGSRAYRWGRGQAIIGATMAGEQVAAGRPGGAAGPDAEGLVDLSALATALYGERYEILELLGVGASGSVYRARDIELGEEVALKVLRKELVSDPATLERFRNEVRLARRVTHRNVARVFDIGEPCPISRREMRGSARAWSTQGPQAMRVRAT